MQNQNQFKLSPSKIDQVRLFLEPPEKWQVTEERLRESLMGTGDFQHPRLWVGEAFHKVLENGPYGYETAPDSGYLSIPTDTKKYPLNEFSTEKIVIETLLEHTQCLVEWRKENPFGVFEIGHSHWVETPKGRRVEISMRIDCIRALEIVDFKFSQREADGLEKMESLQWIIYLMATGAKFFRYCFFTMGDLEENPWCEEDGEAHCFLQPWHVGRFLEYVDKTVDIALDFNLRNYIVHPWNKVA